MVFIHLLVVSRSNSQNNYSRSLKFIVLFYSLFIALLVFLWENYFNDIHKFLACYNHNHMQAIQCRTYVDMNVTKQQYSQLAHQSFLTHTDTLASCWVATYSSNFSVYRLNPWLFCTLALPLQHCVGELINTLMFRVQG